MDRFQSEGSQNDLVIFYERVRFESGCVSLN